MTWEVVTLAIGVLSSILALIFKFFPAPKHKPETDVTHKDIQNRLDKLELKISNSVERVHTRIDELFKYIVDRK